MPCTCSGSGKIWLIISSREFADEGEADADRPQRDQCEQHDRHQAAGKAEASEHLRPP